MTVGLPARLARAALVVAVVGAGALVAPVAAPAVAAAPRHVGIVVAGVGRACASAGGTGLAVLGSRFTVRTGQAPPYLGFVLTINGKGTLRPNNTHYWSYWHNTGSGWKYSGTGAASYRPKAGTVEGWSYVNGKSSPTAPPKYSYNSLCASSDPKPIARTTTHAPAPATTHASKTSAPHPPAAPHTSSRVLVTSTAPSTAARPSATTAATRQQPAVTKRTTSRGTKHVAATSGAPTRHRATATASARSQATSSSTRSTSAAAAQALPSAPPVQQSSASSVPAIGTVVAVVVLAALGGFAFWRTRRRVE